MPGEIIVISHNFCVFWGEETLKTWVFISEKLQILEISEWKYHIGLEKIGGKFVLVRERGSLFQFPCM